MMSKEELKQILKDKPGYLKCGAPKLSRLFNINKRFAKEAVREVKIELQYPVTKFRRLFFDIETSPNIGWFWRSAFKTSITTDQIIEERRVISISWKWEHEDTVHHLNWDDEKDDKEMLIKFVAILNTADEVIGHNHERFDIPWLRTRCIIHRIPFPTNVKSLDTLKKVRSMFNFQSNTLNYIANILGFGTKKPTGGSELWINLTLMPVHMKAYKEYMQTMHDYCDHDVVLLEKVFNTIYGYVKPNTHVGIWAGKPAHSCPKCGSENVEFRKNVVSAGGIIKRHMDCGNCKSDFIISNKAFLKFKENGNS